jgi:hypothetical protein
VGGGAGWASDSYSVDVEFKSNVEWDQMIHVKHEEVRMKGAALRSCSYKYFSVSFGLRDMQSHGFVPHRENRDVSCGRIISSLHSMVINGYTT